MEDIAQRAGVNKQLLFYYFHSKRGLFNAVLTRGAAELEQAFASLAVVGDGPLDRIAGALAAQFDFLAARWGSTSSRTWRRRRRSCSWWRTSASSR